jgi:cell division initiation protein
MAITPVELRNQTFERKFRGYDPFYVDTIMAEAAAEIEKLIDANTESQRQVKSLEERLRSYQNIEQSLKETLLSAQQSAEEKRRVSEREAEARLQETEVACSQLKARYLSEVEQIRLEIASLRMQKVRFAAELKSLIETHARMLEDRQKAELELVAEQESAL